VRGPCDDRAPTIQLEIDMPDPTLSYQSKDANFVDRAADTADRALDATRRAADTVIDTVSDKVESMRSSVSPAVDRATAPFDAVVEYTRTKPLTALLAAAAAGAVFVALFRPARIVRR
jgi:hypothetical protein